MMVGTDEHFLLLTPLVLAAPKGILKPPTIDTHVLCFTLAPYVPIA